MTLICARCRRTVYPVEGKEYQLPTEEFVPVAVVAKRYNLHRSTVWRLIRLGAIPAYRLGRRALRVNLSDVQEFVERHQVSPDPSPGNVSTPRPPEVHEMINRAKRQPISVSSPHLDQSRMAQPADLRLLRALFSRWEPERPELLTRLRPRTQEAARVARRAPNDS